jgi:hypothetical protein
MKIMNATKSIPPSTWLKTDRPVIPVNQATWGYLTEIETALHRGVSAKADSHHLGFYEIEIGDLWYYVHVPKRLQAVYIVAAQRRLVPAESGLLAHQTAC